MKQVIKCGEMLCTDKKTVLKNAYIYIDGNTIVDVREGSEGPDHKSYTLIDLSDKFVMPGLIDTHVHINMNGEANSMGLMNTETIGTIALISLKNAQADLMGGFTTVRDEGAMAFTAIAVRDAIKQGVAWGPRIFCSGMAISATGGHADTHFNPYIEANAGLGLIVNSPDEARKAARYTFKYGADQIKIMATGGVMSVGDDPGSPELTYEEMKAAIDVARSRGRISSAHAHGGGGVKIAVKAGIATIEHGTLMDQECLDLMKEHNTWLVPTLSAGHLIAVNGIEAGIPEFMVQKTELVVDSHFKSTKAAYDQGIRIAFGTDCGTPFDSHGNQKQEFELYTSVGISNMDALLFATKNAAELLQWQDKLGSISKGKLADIVAVDKNPLDDIKAMRDVTFVMKDGVVYKN